MEKKQKILVKLPVKLGDTIMAGYFLRQLGHDIIGIHFLTGFENSAPCPNDNAAKLDIVKKLDALF